MRSTYALILSTLIMLTACGMPMNDRLVQLQAELSCAQLTAPGTDITPETANAIYQKYGFQNEQEAHEARALNGEYAFSEEFTARVMERMKELCVAG